MISGNKEVNNEVQSVTKGDCRRRQGAYYKLQKKLPIKYKNASVTRPTLHGWPKGQNWPH